MIYGPSFTAQGMEFGFGLFIWFDTCLFLSLSKGLCTRQKTRGYKCKIACALQNDCSQLSVLRVSSISSKHQTTANSRKLLAVNSCTSSWWDALRLEASTRHPALHLLEMH